ncbi:hypothetical protein GCM10010464_00300 [Pseudonocardia yunnanensis]
MNGEIPPGDRVIEQRLANEYGWPETLRKSCLERLTGLGPLRPAAIFSRTTSETAATAHLAGPAACRPSWLARRPRCTARPSAGTPPGSLVDHAEPVEVTQVPAPAVIGHPGGIDGHVAAERA